MDSNDTPSPPVPSSYHGPQDGTGGEGPDNDATPPKRGRDDCASPADLPAGVHSKIPTRYQTKRVPALIQVWKRSDLHGTKRRVLLAIAHYANPDGTGAYPSLETIAREAEVKERMAREWVRRLKDAGELEVEYKAGAHGCNRYTILSLRPGNMDYRVQTRQSDATHPAISTQDPAISGPDPATQSAANHPLDHSLNHRPSPAGEDEDSPDSKPSSNDSLPDDARSPLVGALVAEQPPDDKGSEEWDRSDPVPAACWIAMTFGVDVRQVEAMEWRRPVADVTQDVVYVDARGEEGLQRLFLYDRARAAGRNVLSARAQATAPSAELLPLPRVEGEAA